MSARRIINIMDPDFLNTTLLSFDPEPDNTQAYIVMVEKYKLDPVEGDADKYTLNVGSSIRNYSINDRKLTINGCMSFNPRYISTTRTTQGMVRRLLRLLPVGQKRRLEVFNSDSPTDIWWTNVYIDSVDVKEQYKDVVRFQVDFLLPDVYFQKEITQYTIALQDKSSEAYPHWYGQISLNNQSERPSDVTITWNGSEISKYSQIQIISWRYDGISQFSEQSRLITSRADIPSSEWVYKSSTGEFKALTADETKTMWRYVTTAPRMITLYPGNAYLTFRLYHYTADAPTEMPDVKLSYIQYKSDPISGFAN